MAKGDAIPGGEAAPLPAEAEPRADGVDALLERVAAPAPAPAVRLPALAMARVVRVDREGALVGVRGGAEPVLAAIADEVDREVVARAAEVGDAVLVEVVDGAAPVVVGVVQRRVPPDVAIRAATVTIEAEREVVLRAGRSAFRLREDGDVELVGSRLLAMSRGLFRIVGRVLRLN